MHDFTANNTFISHISEDFSPAFIHFVVTHNQKQHCILVTKLWLKLYQL